MRGAITVPLGIEGWEGQWGGYHPLFRERKMAADLTLAMDICGCVFCVWVHIKLRWLLLIIDYYCTMWTMLSVRFWKENYWFSILTFQNLTLAHTVAHWMYHRGPQQFWTGTFLGLLNNFNTVSTVFLVQCNILYFFQSMNFSLNSRL